MTKNVTKVKNKIVSYLWFFLIFLTGFEHEVYAQFDPTEIKPKLYDWLVCLLIYWAIMSFVLISAYFPIYRATIAIRKKWTVQRTDHFTIFLSLLIILPLNFLVLAFICKNFLVTGFLEYGLKGYQGNVLTEQILYIKILYITTAIVLSLWLGNLIHWILCEIEIRLAKGD